MSEHLRPEEEPILDELETSRAEESDDLDVADQADEPTSDEDESAAD